MASGDSDALPAELTAFARGAFEGRRTGSELAELTFDSLLDGDSGAARHLEFCAPAVSIDVEVEGWTLAGRLTPGAAARIDVEMGGVAVVSSGEADASGRFRLALPQGGRVRLRVAPAAPGAPLVESSWITI